MIRRITQFVITPRVVENGRSTAIRHSPLCGEVSLNIQTVVVLCGCAARFVQVSDRRQDRTRSRRFRKGQLFLVVCFLRGILTEITCRPRVYVAPADGRVGSARGDTASSIATLVESMKRPAKVSPLIRWVIEATREERALTRLVWAILAEALIYHRRGFAASCNEKRGRSRRLCRRLSSFASCPFASSTNAANIRLRSTPLLPAAKHLSNYLPTHRAREYASPRWRWLVSRRRNFHSHHCVEHV